MTTHAQHRHTCEHQGSAPSPQCPASDQASRSPCHHVIRTPTGGAALWATLCKWTCSTQALVSNKGFAAIAVMWQASTGYFSAVAEPVMSGF